MKDSDKILKVGIFWHLKHDLISLISACCYSKKCIDVIIFDDIVAIVVVVVTMKSRILKSSFS